MILALATRHRVERPATSMGGGTKNPMERLARRRLDTPLSYTVKSEIRTACRRGFCHNKGAKMELTKLPPAPEEVLTIDGHTIILRFASKSNPGVLDSIQETLFNQKIAPTKSPNFCIKAENVR